MNKIKSLSIVIILLLLALASVSYHKNNIDKINENFKDHINAQKTTIQNIAKNIFYIYKHKNHSMDELNKAVKKFLKNNNYIDSEHVKHQCNKFYSDIKKFKQQIGLTSVYSNILLDKTVNDIYSANLKLSFTIDQFTENQLSTNTKKASLYKNVQYGIFIILLILIAYLVYYISKASGNIDILLKRIDHSIKSIDQIEDDAQELLDDDDLTQQENTIIEALDELMSSSIKLKQLKIDLENLKKLQN